MAHLWTQSSTHEWEPLRLDGDLFALSALPQHVQLLASDGSPDAEVLLRRTAGELGETWTLLACSDSGIRVNGISIEPGIRCLNDRDEMSWTSSTRLFFSTERLAEIRPFPSNSNRGFCPRCKQGMTAGDDAVKCPGCGIWHHASESLPCWTYADSCAACGHATAVDSGFSWTPEEL